ncbi:B-cell antigen receptor complex-associated protein alpha chain [Trachinotus anak]|uniref:B-cell antigen receptor complex-associated protein alpha chain n=1 Tax=Trachinotus anak TaxID=443729 RepID=UPI0039F16B25
MGIAIIFVLCSTVVGTVVSVVTLEADRPFLSVPLSGTAELECCYTTNGKSVTYTWIKDGNKTSGPIYLTSANTGFSADVIKGRSYGIQCGTLTLKKVQLNDTGMYKCLLNNSNSKLFTHGTYLQVHKPLEKTINLSESTKNKILTAEGILLLLCVVLPSASLLCKSKRVHELEKKKMKKEEENIYQGLNLDDCCATYDQIERSQTQGPYQDVCNMMEEEEEIQLEKP